MNKSIKKVFVIIGFVFLLFITNVMPISVIQNNQVKFDIQKELSPKLNNNGITIITPENKTHTVPMNGYYPATYGFENVPDGSDDPLWSDGQGTSAIISTLDGHNKVYQCAGGLLGIGQLWDSEKDYGTIEFYMYNEDATEPFQIQIQRLGVGVAFAIRIINNKFQFNNATGYHDTGKSALDSTWYHVRLDFETSIGGYMGLSQWYWRLFIDGESYGPYSFVNNWVPDRFACYAAPFVSTARAWDAVGYSWDPNYSIGDNLNEGLLLSFEEPTELVGIAYSLDGQANRTILGNTTFKMPEPGLHSIQVVGMDSLGTMYQSDLRYFTVDFHAVSVFLEVPSLPELYNTHIINATVSNIGRSNETNVNLFLYLNEQIVDSIIISNLPRGANETINYSWTPIIRGLYNFTAYASPVPDEYFVEDNFETKLIRVNLFHDMYIDHYLDITDGDTKFRYSFIPSDMFVRGHMYWYAFIFTFHFYWDVDIQTRIMSNNVGDPTFGDVFYDGNHDPGWIFTDVDLGEIIPIATILGGDHLFNVTDELIYDLPNYGPVGVWVLEDLSNPNAIVWYEKSTGILLNGTFHIIEDAYYTYDFRNTNVEFTYAIPPGPFVLSTNADPADEDGVFDLYWEEADGALTYSVYQYDKFINEINGSLTPLAERIDSLTLPLSGYSEGTYYFIVVAHNNHGDTLSNCLKVDIIFPPSLNITIPDSSSSWEAGTSQYIYWTSTVAISNVKLELYMDDVFILEISSDTANDGVYSWTIPLILEDSDQYQIKISDVSNPSIYDYSDYFEIKRPPSGGTPTIPGYNLYILIGMICAVSAMLFKKRYKLLNK